jgi:hypothetical protein
VAAQYLRRAVALDPLGSGIPVADPSIQIQPENGAVPDGFDH